MDIILTFFFLYVALKLTDHFLASKGYKGPVSDHFNGEVFYSYGAENPSVAKKPSMSKRSIFKWLMTRKKNHWQWRDNKATTIPAERVIGDKLVVTFINHASVLIQTAGLNILTDPIWSKRASPFSFLGPSRFRNPGVAFDDLPPIDLVLISHNHYDHMDIPTLARIQEKWEAPILVGLGNGEYLKARNITDIHDLDWWDKFTHKGVTVVCAPGQHFSSRALSDRNKTLWCGFVIETAAGAIYFAGDTGYGPFTEILRSRYKEFRLALLPIGAFRPEWFMGPVHISPDQAMHMHKELKVKTSIGIHHSTFHLADDDQDEPRERIAELVRLSGESAPNFLVLENGESLEVK